MLLSWSAVSTALVTSLEKTFDRDWGRFGRARMGNFAAQEGPPWCVDHSGLLHTVDEEGGTFCANLPIEPACTSFHGSVHVSIKCKKMCDLYGLDAGK